MKPGLKQNPYMRSSPPWIGTPQVSPKVLLPGGGFVAPSAFSYEDAVLFTVGAAGASTDATSVPGAFTHPDGLDIPSDLKLPVGTVLDFGGDKYATLTAEATPAEDASISVRALVTALAENDAAAYAGGRLKRTYIESGTLLGRTYTERAAGTGYGPADPDSDEQMFLLAFSIQDASEDDTAELYMHGNVVYEDFLPNWDSLGATVQAKIRELYVCIIRGEQ